MRHGVTLRPNKLSIIGSLENFFCHVSEIAARNLSYSDYLFVWVTNPSRMLPIHARMNDRFLSKGNHLTPIKLKAASSKADDILRKPKPRVYVRAQMVGFDNNDIKNIATSHVEVQ